MDSDPEDYQEFTFEIMKILSDKLNTEERRILTNKIKVGLNLLGNSEGDIKSSYKEILKLFLQICSRNFPPYYEDDDDEKNSATINTVNDDDDKKTPHLRSTKRRKTNDDDDDDEKKTAINNIVNNNDNNKLISRSKRRSKPRKYR